MVSLPRHLIVACSLVLGCLSPTGFVCNQVYGQQVSSFPTSEQGYNSGVIIDHSSMSPDSWSAPATPSSPVVAVEAPNAASPNTLRGASRPVTPFQQATRSTFSPDRTQAGFSPSIPDLNAAATRQTTNQIRSLIRQPSINSENGEFLGNQNNSVQSPFQSAKYAVGGQDDLSSTSAAQNTLSNTSLPAFSNQSALPQTINSATGKFDLAPATNPVVNNLPSAAAPSATSATASPAFSQPTTQLGPGRYPLGINGSVMESSPIQVQPDIPPTSYDALTTGSQQGSQSYPNYEVSNPATSQPIFQQQPIANPITSQPVFQQPPVAGSPAFRPDLGHRDPSPTFRGRDHDSGLKMDFEDKKKQFPGLGETLATGRYFGSVGIEYLEAAFQNNSAITQFNSTPDMATFASSESFDFDFETAPRLRFGFESKLGPGVEFDYFQYDQNSDVTSFTSNGLNSGQLSSGSFGPSSLTTLQAVNAGETLAATAGIDLETFSVSFFKEIKFPISRLNGMFGFQYTSIFQTFEGQLTDAGGNVIGSLLSTSDLRAYGPKFRLEYYRPIGHTKLEFITKVGGGVLFGNRDQIIVNTGLPAVNRFSANELALTGDFYGGVQFKQNTAENRAYYVRLGVTHQTWIGGGTAVDAQETFGLRGFAFEVGLNR